MAIINQIEPLNLTPVLIVLYRIQYQFASNRRDVLSQFDSEIANTDSNIQQVDESIEDAERGLELEIERLNGLNVDTEGCSVADKNKRRDNVVEALENRKSELQNNLSDIEAEREENKRFYDTILGTIREILQALLGLLSRLLNVIGNAISTIETAVTSLAAIPLGGGLSGVAVLSFVIDLLQSKIYEPVKDTIDQQEEYADNAPPLE